MLGGAGELILFYFIFVWRFWIFFLAFGGGWGGVGWLWGERCPIGAYRGCIYIGAYKGVRGLEVAPRLQHRGTSYGEFLGEKIIGGNV